MKFILALSMLLLVNCAAPEKKSGTTAPAAKGSAATQDTAAKSVKKETMTPAEGSVVCSYNEIQREILIKNQDGNCTVDYTKDGTTNEIATGLAASNFCNEVQDRIKNNLTAAGYTCK